MLKNPAGNLLELVKQGVKLVPNYISPPSTLSPLTHSNLVAEGSLCAKVILIDSFEIC